MLSKREAFKVAFLRRCADAGMTLEETHELVKSALAREKQAGVWPWLLKNIPGLSLIGDTVSGAAKGVVPKIVNYGAAAAIGAPLVAGGLAGYGLAKAKGINEPEPDEIKAEETRDFYRRAAAQALAKARMKRRRAGEPVRRTPRLLV